jgi:hypothetical protein
MFGILDFPVAERFGFEILDNLAGIQMVPVAITIIIRPVQFEFSQFGPVIKWLLDYCSGSLQIELIQFGNQMVIAILLR